ncbi:hypothetical protein BKA81DRAFT_29887 [Phyllosticta paracitricarpa]
MNLQESSQAATSAVTIGCEPPSAAPTPQALNSKSKFIVQSIYFPLTSQHHATCRSQHQKEKEEEPPKNNAVVHAERRRWAADFWEMAGRGPNSCGFHGSYSRSPCASSRARCANPGSVYPLYTIVFYIRVVGSKALKCACSHPPKLLFRASENLVQSPPRSIALANLLMSTG